jgi:hypothetical protein
LVVVVGAGVVVVVGAGVVVVVVVAIVVVVVVVVVEAAEEVWPIAVSSAELMPAVSRQECMVS